MNSSEASWLVISVTTKPSSWPVSEKVEFAGLTRSVVTTPSSVNEKFALGFFETIGLFSTMSGAQLKWVVRVVGTGGTGGAVICSSAAAPPAL